MKLNILCLFKKSNGQLINGALFGIAERRLIYVDIFYGINYHKIIIFVNYIVSKLLSMSTRGFLSFLVMVLFLVLLHFTNPTKEKHIELLKTKLPDEYAVDMGDDNAFGNRFQYTNDYFFSFTVDMVGDTHERTSIGILGFVF